MEKFGLKIFEGIDSFPFVRDKIAIIPYSLAKQRTVLPLFQNEQGVTVAVHDPLDLDSLEEIRLLLKSHVIAVYSPKPLIEAAIERCYSQKAEETKKFFSNLEKETEGSPQGSIEEYDLLEQSDQNPVIRLVNTLLSEAIQQGASDIHFEPVDEGLSVRYRIDGVLQKKHTPPREFQLQILTRIKVMAKMDIAERRLPQDGRIKLKLGGREIDFRVSTLPVVHGERIVLRILDKGNVLLGLDKISMPEAILKAFRSLIQTPEGIVLVTGPTGSGKTTTLYSALSEINSPEMNIMTIEDPVEIRLAGISQMHVNRNIELDFSKGLRHILRQDPDVIMIGEIRDKETAEIAIQSSLTGHLVLSTLHTNDAPSALTRLADMGIEPYLLASSILGVLAQRLVRRICPHCKAKSKVDGNFYGAGCIQCFGTGFKGRSGIYELMAVTSQIKAQVLKSQDAEELRKVALSQNMISLQTQGMHLVKEGITTSAEVLRVTKIADESL